VIRREGHSNWHWRERDREGSAALPIPGLAHGCQGVKVKVKR
jgi:hypothetical protein